MTRHLQRTGPEQICGRIKRRPKGWSPERRARQAALIRSWQPWRRSTGPKTEAGKTRCAMNALKHGQRSQAAIREFQRIRYALRLAEQNIKAVRLLIQLRRAAARPSINYKPWYEAQLRSANLSQPFHAQSLSARCPSLEKGGSNCPEPCEGQFGEGSFHERFAKPPQSAAKMVLRGPVRARSEPC